MRKMFSENQIRKIAQEEATGLPTTTTADLVLKSTSTAGTVVWGTAGGGAPKYYKHTLAITSIGQNYTVVGISTSNTAITDRTSMQKLIQTGQGLYNVTSDLYYPIKSVQGVFEDSGVFKVTFTDNTELGITGMTTYNDTVTEIA